jgi:bifunctional DNA-binding transcriptional regulator/antitoxin component of YhaV-PrlF toxin-antitoxin module
MQTRVSKSGRVELPGQLRRKLGIRAGDVLEASVETDEGAGRIVLTVQEKPKYEVKIITDPATGWPALSAGPDAPVLTSEMVAELLADFP